ncbi:MAG: Transcriptional regulator, AcrR family [Candidatus Bipolaricaulis sibiricus]|uniref:Transcriptional regulator, AcrR family n=1 Tax=Bipolaricaulis sibiricus TaxID=2501609 RepID=A0A410FT47_BIPS1|nr:MAG: Transcriptional regulator, AcrR family [Candidatus Bipolaricaulis sibiricus]
MSRPMTVAERQAVRARLLRAGRELFARYGLKKTTVEELAQAAGVAKGTFYLFFPSKEALYGQVLLDEVPRLVARLVERSFGATPDIREALVRFQEEVVALIESDEIVRVLAADPHQPAELLEGHLDLQEFQARAMEALRPLFSCIRTAQQEGQIVGGDIAEIFAVLGVIKLVAYYRKHIAPDLYPRLVKRLSRVIADGLTCPAGTKT